MRERAINIGSPWTLSGVLTEPTQQKAEKPTIVILNSGALHHVGACRLSVKLSRELAEHAGMPALRFDFSGIGDSDDRARSDSLEQVAVNEIREVLDYLEQQRGIGKFILCGLCSGAHNAFQAAIVDKRVVGLIQYNGYCYPTWKSYLRYYGRRLFKWKHWRSAGLRAMARIPGIASPTSKLDESTAVIDQRFVEKPLFADKPAKATMQAGLQKLVERQVRMLYVFTDGYRLTFMYPRQYTDCFSAVDFKDLCEVVHFPNATHIIAEPHYQKIIIQRTLNWAQSL